MPSLKRTMITGVSLLALGAGAYGAREAMRSPMFMLQVVELADLPEAAPVDAQAITHLAALPVGRINLFDLDLKPVEERILSQPWIREVRLEKHFPQTLSISIVFREPQALLQAENGSLSYVDLDGKVFGQVNLMVQPDLPVISSSGAGHLPESVQVIRGWEQTELSKAAQLSDFRRFRSRS
jgi:cell division septal protein FtsQ